MEGAILFSAGKQSLQLCASPFALICPICKRSDQILQGWNARLTVTHVCPHRCFRHVEDNHLYATNYLQAGAPKVWFGVPKSHMEKMEEIWRSAFPHLFARHPDLHYWKTCIFSPMVLHAHGVPVYRVVHEAGVSCSTGAIGGVCGGL